MGRLLNASYASEMHVSTCKSSSVQIFRSIFKLRTLEMLGPSPLCSPKGDANSIQVVTQITTYHPHEPAHWLQITTHRFMAAHSGFAVPQSAQKLLLGSAQICSATSQLDRASWTAFCMASTHCLHSCSDSAMKLQSKINALLVNGGSAAARRQTGDQTAGRVFPTADVERSKQRVNPLRSCSHAWQQHRRRLKHTVDHNVGMISFSSSGSLQHGHNRDHKYRFTTLRMQSYSPTIERFLLI